MINRILIRIKVIQILYSFLLVEKRFSIESVPSAPTKEKRFAYALYIDMLLLMIKVAQRLKLRRNDTPLLSTRFIARLLVDESVKSALAAASGSFPYEKEIDSLVEVIKESAIFKNYQKEVSKEVPTAESDLWKNLFNLVIMRDPRVDAVTRGRENYTMKGVERMQEMMERTFVNFLTSQDNVREVENALSRSLDDARDLYLRFMCMPVEITDLQEKILDENRHKFLKTEEDINPNLRFVENGLVEELRGNEVIEKYLEEHSWDAEDPVLFRKLLDAVLGSEIYREYMSLPHTDLFTDCELWRNLFKNVILENQELLEALEDKSVFWNDDVEIISTFVLKCFRRVGEQSEADVVLDKFKDEEDARFGRDLVRAVYRNKDNYRRYINEALDSGRWDKDRLVFMDIVIMMTALAEIMNFPKIPLQASLNEYIEIAKSYSSTRSGAFVNGILGSVVARLQAEGKLLKK